MPKRTHYAESVLFIETDGSAIGYVNLEIVPFDPVIRQNGLGALDKLSGITTSAMFQQNIKRDDCAGTPGLVHFQYDERNNLLVFF